jgi:LacI family transcriptional regulator
MANGLPRVCPDSRKVGELAAEHLMERGFRHFAFVGARGDLPWSSRFASNEPSTC